MRNSVLTFAAAWLFGILAVSAQPSDPRLRQIWYDPHAVVTVPVKRGIVTDIVLDAGEAITDVASGLGGDCAKPDAATRPAHSSAGRTIDREMEEFLISQQLGLEDVSKYQGLAGDNTYQPRKCDTEHLPGTTESSGNSYNEFFAMAVSQCEATIR